MCVDRVGGCVGGWVGVSVGGWYTFAVVFQSSPLFMKQRPLYLFHLCVHDKGEQNTIFRACLPPRPLQRLSLAGTVLLD